MRAVLLTVVLFAAWWGLGLAMLGALRADLRDARIVLVAPALGSCVIVLPAFALNRLGVPIGDLAVPLVAVLGVAAGTAVAWRRARPTLLAPVSVLGVCGAGLLLIWGPMREFGLTWLGLANDDMTHYALSARRLSEHGLWAGFDLGALATGRDYATTALVFVARGQRPGSDTMSAFIQTIAGRSGPEIWMPFVVAAHLTGACAAGALALQTARRWWAAPLAAALVVVSAMATYGVLAQLGPQVWGLALAAALLALLARPELHDGNGPGLSRSVPVALLACGLALVYLELVPTVAAAYGAYLLLLATRRRLAWRAIGRLWAPMALVAVVVFGGYLVDAAGFVESQVSHAGSISDPAAPLFGFILVPSGLPTALGLQAIPGVHGAALDLSILAAAILILGIVAVAVRGAWGGGAAAIVVLVQTGLAVLLSTRSADFGLFKLTMFAVPFVAAAVAAWATSLRRVTARAALAAVLVAVAAASLSTQGVYVKRSRNPGDAPFASAMHEAFQRILTESGGRPVVSAMDNIFLIELQAVTSGDRPLLFLSRDVYGNRIRGSTADDRDAALRAMPWRTRRFDLREPGARAGTAFRDAVAAGARLAAGDCMLALPTGAHWPFNRRTLPEGPTRLVGRPCRSVRDVLVFVQSGRGQHFYLSLSATTVSYYQLEPDFFFPGRTFAGFGRHALLRVLRPSPGARLVVELTQSLRVDGVNRLPRAALVGAQRRPLGLVGRGSARVVSPPLRPQLIGGHPYVMLDLGPATRAITGRRTGLQGLFGRDTPVDPRYLSAHVRDVSLVDTATYARRRPPAALHSFPADLGNPDLEYSGLYEDGWVGERAWVRLAGGPAGTLVIEGSKHGVRGTLRVRVDGRRFVGRQLASGPFSVRVSIPASRGPRRVELALTGLGRLSGGDRRPVAARLSYLGLG